MERLDRRHETNKREDEMKVTRKQLRSIIREAINEVRPHNRGTEGYEMTAQSAVDKKMNDAIMEVLEDFPGMSGAELVDAVNQMHPSVDAEMIYEFLDELLDDGEIFFNVAADEYSLDPTGISAEAEFENAGIRAREMMKRR